jgi:hypothetical protein
MNWRSGNKRLFAALSVAYFVLAVLHAVSFQLRDTAAYYQSFVGDLHYSDAYRLKLYRDASFQGWGDAGMLFASYFVGYLLVLMLIFTTRWIVRGYRGEQAGRDGELTQ